MKNKRFTIIIILWLIFLGLVKIKHVGDSVEPTEYLEPVDSTDSLEPVAEYLARITCYKWTGNRMANGLYPEEGWVATSDRSIPFGTIIEIEGVEYKVGDRTARWVNEQFEYPTIDIYLDNCSLDYGASIKKIIIK